MWTSYLQINKAGLLSMIQDGGRLGHESYGVPASGCMDKYSAQLANLLVGNNPSQSLLELNFVGPEIKVMGDIYIAITGADMHATINGNEILMYETIYARDGSVLNFKNSTDGNRTYLAIAGEIESNQWLASTSAYMSIPIPMLNNNTLTKGMKIKVENTQMVNRKICPERFRTPILNDKPIRIVMGPEYNWFSPDQIQFFSNHSFTIDQKSNRMAINVKEILPDYYPQRELISSGILPGTIQISNSGSPIILMREAGTTGGYPRIAKVIDPDIDRLAQLPPDHQFKFEFISYDAAQKVIEEERDNWSSLLHLLSSKLKR